MKKTYFSIIILSIFLLSCGYASSAEKANTSFDLVFDKGLVPSVSFSSHDGLFTLVDNNGSATLTGLEVNYQLSRIGVAYEGLSYELLLILSDDSYASDPSGDNEAFMLKYINQTDDSDNIIGLNYDVEITGYTAEPESLRRNLADSTNKKITIAEDNRNQPLLERTYRQIKLIDRDDFANGEKYAVGTFTLKFTMNKPLSDYLNGTYSGYAILRLNIN